MGIAEPSSDSAYDLGKAAMKRPPTIQWRKYYEFNDQALNGAVSGGAKLLGGAALQMLKRAALAAEGFITTNLP